MRVEAEIFRKQMDENTARMDEAEKRIIQEREDRVKYHDDHLNPIRAQLKNIQEGLVKEKKVRVANEKKVMQSIRDESQNMQDDIKNENKMRKKRMQDLDDQMTQDTDLTRRFLDNFESNATNTATSFMNDLETELENRFDHQDQILTNMSTLIGKYQETLKILGKDG